ncbi:MAG: flotillin-like protein FloA [Phycisphaerae bacterium]|nr:flotillin-like protein FloA [Phycisphaerae bacterium]NUQ50382.1 flotillin-like protein FloA [Phycisphaerae bacterium]
MHAPLLLAQDPWNWVWVVVAIGALLLAAVLLIVFANFGALYVKALVNSAKIGLAELVRMWLAGVQNNVIVFAKIRAYKAGLTDISTNDLAAHYLAGGRVPNVVQALISAHRAKIPLDYRTACAIDLAGRDIVDAVHTSVNPKVIDCPNPASGRSTIDAVAKDGIQLKVKARVTVRTNIQRLIGGATEETIIARVGEGIVSAIGSAQAHKDVLENPDKISKAVLHKGLDSGTAFEILSIDIADVDVGANIGAQLQADQAEADKKRFQAEAEKRRALAVALEQENRAKIEENRALVVLAEAEIPKAIATAFVNGNLGVIDYYRLRNIQADTQMRQSIGGEGQPQPTTKPVQ